MHRERDLTVPAAAAAAAALGPDSRIRAFGRPAGAAKAEGRAPAVHRP